MSNHPIFGFLKVASANGDSALRASTVRHMINRRNLGRRYNVDEAARLVSSNKLVKLSAPGLEPAVALPGVVLCEASVALWLARSVRAPWPNHKGATGASVALLSPSQGAAWHGIPSGGASILTGGPGTGKTYLTALIVQSAVNRGMKVVVAAPTGKAASVLELKMQALGARVVVNTVHKTLEWRPGSKPGLNSYNKIDCDLLVVDECSQLDSEAMANIFNACHTDTSVLLVGDPDQLPPVGVGTPFRSMREATGGMIKVYTLSEVHRQSADSGVIKLAQSISQGKFEVPSTDVKVYNVPSNEVADWIVEKYCASALLVKEKLVLTATRKSKFDSSSATINEKISHSLFEKRRIQNCKFTTGDRIMFTVNDSRHGYVNGQMGFLVDHDYGGRKRGDLGQTVIVTDCGRQYDISGWSIGANAEWAYALTIHKAQGSEADTVILAVTDEASMMYTRSLIYTAVTRAKRKLVIVGDIDILKRAVKNAVKNVTALDYLLANGPEYTEKMVEDLTPKDEGIDFGAMMGESF